MLNKWATIGAIIFTHFWDIATFVLGHFILPHSVYLALLRAEYIRNGATYRHRYDGMLIGTYTSRTQGYRFEWSWVTFSDLAKYSVTWSNAQSFCDSWTSCSVCKASVSSKYSCSDRTCIFWKTKYAILTRSRDCCMQHSQQRCWSSHHKQFPRHRCSRLPDVRHAHYRQPVSPPLAHVHASTKHHDILTTSG